MAKALKGKMKSSPPEQGEAMSEKEKDPRERENMDLAPLAEEEGVPKAEVEVEGKVDIAQLIEMLKALSEGGAVGRSSMSLGERAKDKMKARIGELEKQA